MRRLTLPPLLGYQRRALASSSRRILFVGGVGSGKTHALALMVLRGVAENPGVDGAIFAPSFRLLKRVTLPSIQRVLPSELYSWRPADQELRFVNGSRVYCMGVDRTPAERILGMNLGWAVWDEAGASRDGDIIGLITERLRAGNSSKRFVALFTSPHGFSWLPQWADEDEVEVIRASTYENTFLDRGYLEMLEREYPPGSLLHRQEMLGEFVSRAGRVYGDVFSRALHTVDWEGSSSGPYILSVDPGYRASAWLAWQRAPSGAWVVVQEWLPEGEATEDSARKVRRARGRPPERVLMDTPSRQNSRLHVNDYEAIVDVFGASCKVRVLGGHERSSDWRHKAVLAGLRSGALRLSRRLCPARIGQDERGIIHALETMEWPDESTRSERMEEKSPLKHVADALELGAAVLTPPKLARSEDRAGHLRAA